MKTVFHAQLVNDVFGDPGLYVELPLDRRALLFDLGDISRLSPRQLLRVSDVFVSHAHKDHFVGFDRLLRVMLGRTKKVRLYGPVGFIDQVAARLAGYTWNLLGSYDEVLEFEVTEVLSHGELWTSTFRSDQRFEQGRATGRAVDQLLLRDEPGLRVRAAVLDHHTECLGFRLEERLHLGVLKAVVHGMGLQLGPWIHDVRQALLAEMPGQTVMRVWWTSNGETTELSKPLSELRAAFTASSGQVLSYVVDAGFTPWNERQITALARNADFLFIEAAFLNELSSEALARRHLTAWQAGNLAHRAGAKRVTGFHFSQRHEDQAEMVKAEVLSGFRGDPEPLTTSK